MTVSGTLRSRMRALVLTLGFTLAFAQPGPQGPVVPEEYLDRIRRLDGDTVRVCVNIESLLAPFERDLALEIGRALLLDVSIIDVRGRRAPTILDYRLSLNEAELYLLLNNSCHALAGFLLSTSRFAEWLTPTRPYAEHRFVFATRLPIDRLGQLPATAAVGTRMASTADVAFTQTLHTMPEQARWRRVPYVNNQLLIDRLNDGAVDAILVWEPALLGAFGSDLAAAGIHRLEPSPVQLVPQQFGFVMLAADGFLRIAVDGAIAILAADGTIDDLLTRHNIPGAAARAQ